VLVLAQEEGGPKWLTWQDAQEVRRKCDELLLPPPPIAA
jgi:hypothetical protein